MNDPQELRKVEAFADLDDDQILWLAERARLVTVEPGEVLLGEGAPADTLFAILEGEVRMRREQGPAGGHVIVRKAGKVTGMLPFSRLTHSPVTARASVRTRVACFPRDDFPEMLERIPVLQARLAAAMVDRSREFTRQDELRERLMSLGKLAAGLAHELNNPAAAIQRRADELSQRLRDLSDIARSLVDRVAAPDGPAPLAAWLAARRGSQGTELEALERSDAEDRLTAWLESRQVPNAWLAAETFVSAGLTEAELERAAQGVPAELLPFALRWLEADVASRRSLDDLSEAARRITELIASVKAYSNMDRGPEKSEIDVHEGIHSTLAMLGHKLRHKNVRLVKELGPDLPLVSANPGELNQVWTNLIDNAIDAVPPGGEILVRTTGSEAGAIVQVIDDGPGIPAEIQARVFDPFFTTKEVGEGTGLGLDIVRRIILDHQGDVHVESSPGRTCFEVRLPAVRSP